MDDLKLPRLKELKKKTFFLEKTNMHMLRQLKYIYIYGWHVFFGNLGRL